MLSSVRLVPAVAVVLFGLVACATPSTGGVSAPIPTGPSGSPANAPSAEAADPAVVVDRIVFRADSFDVLAADGSVIATSNLLEDGAAILDTFEAAFGTEPQESAYAGGVERQPGMMYDWDGLRVYVGERPYNYFEQEITVEITAAALDDVELVTAEGISVGTSREQFEGSPAFEPQDPAEFVLLVEPVTVGTAEEAGFPGDHPDGDLVWSIVVSGDATGVAMLSLPEENYGV